MPTNNELSGSTIDGALASGLISAPAWAPWLSGLNEFLTTLTLSLGVILGLARLWLFLKSRKK